MSNGRKGFNTATKDLKRGMEILTEKGWRTVNSSPQPWLGGTLLVRLTTGKFEVAEPGYLWVRRFNTLHTKEKRR